MAVFGSLSTYERRRLALALIVTAVALPALWWSKKDNPIASPSVAAIDAGQALDAGSAANIAAVDTPPGYLSGPAESLPPLLEEPTGPPIEETFTRAGFASYRNFTVQATDTGDEDADEGSTLPARLCEVSFLPIGTRITIENTDNGKRVECFVDRAQLEPGITLVMDSSLFVALADLADAPIPVRIRW